MVLQAVRRRWTEPVRARVLDRSIVAVLGLLYLGLALAELHEEPVPVVLVGCALVTARTLPLLARRTRPAQVLAATLVIDLIIARLFDQPDDLVSLPSLVALYSAGRYLPFAKGWVAGGLAMAATGIGGAFIKLSQVPGALVGTMLVVVLGQYNRLRTEMAERTRQERATAAVHAERRRIARELHDVVAHHISVMNVLVGAARTTMALDPAQAQEALATTERTAREAMAEMRQLLSVLRADDTLEEPEPGARTARLPDLVDRAGAAGVPADLRVVGEARPLPSAVDLAVYRIVQEALTNAHKHAYGARVAVNMRYEHAAIDVEVVDDGPGINGSTIPGGGYGLNGMAERVALCGGRLNAGPVPGRGFRVHARIPLEPLAAPEAAPEAAVS